VAYGTVVQLTSKMFIKFNSRFKDKIKIKIKLHVQIACTYILSSLLSSLISAHINRTIVAILKERQIEGIIMGSGVASTAVDGWYTLADGAQITDDTSFCWETGPFIHSQSISANSKSTMGISHRFAS